jgi:hypothetical protein
MRHTSSQTLYHYWNELRGKRRAPHRRDIQPRAIKNFLSDIFILEREDSLTYTFRLAGTNVCEIFGREMRGSNVLGLWSRHERESIESLLFSVVEDAAAAVLGLEATTESGETAIIEIIFLPIKAEETTMRILGAVSFKEKPHWFGTAPVISLEVKSIRLLWPDHTPRFSVKTDAGVSDAGVSDAGKPVLEPPFGDNMPARRRAHLKVIQGGLNDS